MAVSQLVMLLWVIITGGTWQVPHPPRSHRESGGMLFALTIWGGFGLKCLTLAFNCVFEQQLWSPRACAGQMWHPRVTGEDVWGEVGEFQGAGWVGRAQLWCGL